MPRDGALVLSDLRNPTLSIVCEPCGRRGTYNVPRLMEQHGDAKLTDLLQMLADCPKARSAGIHDRARRCSTGWPYNSSGKGAKAQQIGLERQARPFLWPASAQITPARGSPTWSIRKRTSTIPGGRPRRCTPPPCQER
jgi:hypothetical protein